MDSVSKSTLIKLPPSLASSPSKSSFSFSTPKPFIHNSYSDLKNIWAPTAIKKDKMDFLSCFFISTFIFFLGSLSSMIFVHWFIADTPSLIPPVREVLQPIIIKEIQEDSLDTYINYASISNKAEIISEFSTAEYHGALSWFSNNRRESALSDDNSLGNCWAFAGNQGQLAIQLGYEIYPEQFFMRHVNIVDYVTAPKQFKVWSTETSTESNKCSLLGIYSFDLRIKGEKRKAWELFKCKNSCDIAISGILLEIDSNYGGNNTCVYQFGLHGRPK
ncbi:SUN3_1 [Blepharisma stoltei]|uniref:SUN domain-containing protein n=1 Tax=Blepharisma stoltei TaxID=1481888 RepID=A0AAU9J5I1_9CILI|nr:unnamed protein product [Blepharisma stoltei]